MDRKQINWAKILKHQASSGLSGAAYCHRQGLEAHQFCYHKNKEQRGKSAEFIYVCRLSSEQISKMEVEVNGVRVRFSDDAGSAAITKVLRSVDYGHLKLNISHI